MKLLLLLVLVNGVFSYFNYPNFNPENEFLNGDKKDPTAKYFGKACKQQFVFDGQGNFTTFIRLSDLKNNKPRKGSKERLNTVICYQGSPSFRVGVTELKKNTVNGDSFIAAELSAYSNRYDYYYSDVYYENFRQTCDSLVTPPYFGRYFPNCISLELEDNYSSDGGRLSISVLGKYPVTSNCFDVPLGLISGLNYLTLTTNDRKQRGGIFWYDCDSKKIPLGIYGRKPGIYVDVEQNQVASN